MELRNVRSEKNPRQWIASRQMSLNFIKLAFVNSIYVQYREQKMSTAEDKLYPRQERIFNKEQEEYPLTLWAEERNILCKKKYPWSAERKGEWC